VEIGQGLAAVGKGEDRPAADAVLLRAGQAGDLAALERLLAPHERALLALCRGILGHAEDAEDAAQETFLRALRALPRFQPGRATFRTWLFRIAVNVCLNWKRDRHPTLAWEEELCPGAEAHSPETLALYRLQVAEALGTLPRRHRAVFLLKVGEGWSVAEIGATFGWNAKRVENELYRARRALAEWQARIAEEDEG
jgi:RNA polymerase sigma-70 factor (ECF subfamily)